jgi:hypothetical protein
MKHDYSPEAGISLDALIGMTKRTKTSSRRMFGDSPS